jgi:cytochrome oxidase Cu insertion factor (SCO1/SenC/PrrC family)
VAAVVAITALWVAPRLQPPTGTLVVVGAARTGGTSVTPAALMLRQGGGWISVGTVSGDVPAAPAEGQLLAVPIAAGSYDGVRLAGQTEPVSLMVVAGQVSPLLLGIDDLGRLVPGAVYAGNDEVNLGLGELAGKFVAAPAFDLVDQGGHAFNLQTVAGRDVVIAAFHTTCHETCPLYTALFLQLAKHLPAGVSLVEVTTDPSVDAPPVLADYAQRVGASWTLATGATDKVAYFWKFFGVELAAGDSHTSTLALIDRHGFIRLVYRGVPKIGNDIPPSVVTSLSANGLAQLASGGDGWGTTDVLQALATIARPGQSLEAGGGTAPGFTLTSTDGRQTSLADFAGKPVVINFWASYCPPCKAEMPLLAKQVGASSARLILVNEGEGAGTALSFLSGLGVHEPALLDRDLRVGRAYGMSALPMTVFVRTNGTIDRRQIGEIDSGVLAAELSNLTGQ